MITATELARERTEALDRIYRATRTKDDLKRLLTAARVTAAAPENRKNPDAKTQVHSLRTDYAEAYGEWRDTLFAEYDRELLQPLAIYKAAGITKQMFSKLRSAARTPPTTTPATTTLPPTAVLLP